MTDHRVSTAAALLGLVVTSLVLGAVVAGLSTLVGAGEQLPPLAAPAPAADRCAAAVGADVPMEVSASDLIECPTAYDGVRVAYTGEVVRAVLDRGDHAVVQVNDDPYALDLGPLPTHRTAVGGNSGIPVIVPEAAASAIQHVGDYRHHGDLVEVVGTFLQADPQDAGGPTISADRVTVRRPGQVLDHPVDPTRIVVAVVLTAAVLVLAVANRVRDRT